MTTRYAFDTSVNVESSLLEIRRIINRYGATGFGLVEEDGRAGVTFKCANRTVRIVLELPDKNDDRFRYTETGRPRRSEAAVIEAWEQECRRSWRALALVIKAKLEAVASEIATFDEEFMAYVVLPDGLTVGQHTLPVMRDALASGHVPALLPSFEGGRN
jgi:hypothetical protein